MPQSGDGLLPGAHCHDPGQGGDWLRVEAALLLADGQPELAAQKAREGLNAATQFYDRGLAQTESEWMQIMVLPAK